MVDVLAVGYSVRALARSALRAGLEVAAIDAFGDRDLAEPLPRPQPLLVMRPFDAAQLEAVAPPSRRLAWTSSLENAPAALAALGRSRQVIGNGAEVVSRIRDPGAVARVLEGERLPTARVLSPAAAAAGGRRVLRKPRAGGGGHGVERWSPGVPAGAETYLQEEVAGAAGSFLFLADGVHAEPVMVTRQLVGEPAFGATGYTWCGNLVGPAVLAAQADVGASALAAARALTSAFGLRGLNGIDFIARAGEAVVIEVNPRWTGSAELAERATGASLFSRHVRASAGELCGGPVRAARVAGKAVVYATRDWRAGNTDAWLANPDVRDVPASGAVIPARAPICTVLADADNADACLAALGAKAGLVLAA